MSDRVTSYTAAGGPPCPSCGCPPCDTPPDLSTVTTITMTRPNITAYGSLAAGHWVGTDGACYVEFRPTGNNCSLNLYIYSCAPDSGCSSLMCWDLATASYIVPSPIDCVPSGTINPIVTVS